MPRVAGKVAIVTGGAMGIGQACAELLVPEGAAVVVTDRETESGKAVVDALEAAGHRAMFIEHDVGDEEGWKKVIDATVNAFGTGRQEPFRPRMDVRAGERPRWQMEADRPRGFHRTTRTHQTALAEQPGSSGFEARYQVDI